MGFSVGKNEALFTSWHCVGVDQYLIFQYLLLLLSCVPDNKDGGRDEKKNREGVQGQGNRNQTLQTLTKECCIIIWQWCVIEGCKISKDFYICNVCTNANQVSVTAKRNLNDEEEDEENRLNGVRRKSPNPLDGNCFLSQNLIWWSDGCEYNGGRGCLKTVLSLSTLKYVVNLPQFLLVFSFNKHITQTGHSSSLWWSWPGKTMCPALLIFPGEAGGLDTPPIGFKAWVKCIFEPLRVHLVHFVQKQLWWIENKFVMNRDQGKENPCATNGSREKAPGVK